MIAMELSINNFIQSCSHDSKGVVYQQIYTELYCLVAMELGIENFIQSCTA